MNTYSKLLIASLAEIDCYSETEEGRKYELQWYKELKKSVIQAADADEDQKAEKMFKYITRSIVDSGPLSGDFAPSLKIALDADERKQHHKSYKKNKP
ncbi:MAG: hypothetical protein ABSC11_10460 [Smithella sp.]|jgi:hypothetical protein